MWERRTYGQQWTNVDRGVTLKTTFTVQENTEWQNLTAADLVSLLFSDTRFWHIVGIHDGIMYVNADRVKFWHNFFEHNKLNDPYLGSDKHNSVWMFMLHINTVVVITSWSQVKRLFLVPACLLLLSHAICISATQNDVTQQITTYGIFFLHKFLLNKLYKWLLFCCMLTFYVLMVVLHGGVVK